MRLIFLDIDGVLCTPESYANSSGSHAKPVKRCVAALARICEATDARIVISSTWRFEGIMFMREWLAAYGLNVGVPGGRAAVIGCTEWPPLESRGLEIKHWLDDFPCEVESFVILDDDADMGNLSLYLIHVEGHVGLTAADAERAISMLLQKIEATA